MPWIRITLTELPGLAVLAEDVTRIDFTVLSFVPLAAALLSILMIAIVISQDKPHAIHRMFLWLNLSACLWALL